jgi:hypothetical protein
MYKETVTRIEASDLVERALVLVQSPLPHVWARQCIDGYGVYCPCCAVATAASQLTEEHNLGFTDTDGPLTHAASYLKYCNGHDLAASVAKLNEALEILRRL